MTENDEKPSIVVAIPDEIRGMHPHAQIIFDKPGLFVNVLTPVLDNGLADLSGLLERFETFLRSDDAFFAFESPHLPGTNYLTRNAAEHAIGIMPVWSAKVLARTNNKRIALVTPDGFPIRA